MHHYIILANPGHNRIYHDAAMGIAALELEAIAATRNLTITKIEAGDPALPATLHFSTDRILDADDLRALGQSSIYYALFEAAGEGLLKPLAVPDFHTFPESMVQILKYNGKTNEQFTRLMVNLALSACETASDKPVLLDPMCGKGTTLYEGMIRGLDVKGIEIHDKWVHEIQVYLLRYMQEGLYKHHAGKGTQSDDKGRKVAGIFTLTAAVDKDDYKHGQVQTCQVISADTRIADRLIKKHSCDMIVTDLPYGVQHGSKADRKSRSPLDLLNDALPAWSDILKHKGSMILAFNEYTLNYADIARLLEQTGYHVLKDTPYIGFSHWVDQSIKRNVIVAVKT